MPHTTEINVTPQAKLRALTAVFLTVCLILLVGILGGIAYLVYNGLEQGQRNYRELDEVIAISERLKDCTVPDGKCYKRSQESTAAAVGTINTSAVYAAFCADKPQAQTVAEIKDCILEQFKKEGN